MYYALDCTNPEVQEHLREIFRTIVQDWGYEYLKLDFIYAAALEGEYFNMQATRAQSYRIGMETIREAVGDKIFILGCGAPIFQSIGLVNGMRVSGDVDPSWLQWTRTVIGSDFVPGVANVMKNSILRYFFHNKFWVNDPDCLLVRKDKTRLNIEEVKTLTSVIGLTGGQLFLSDNLSTLCEDRLKFFSSLLPVFNASCKPVDFLQNEMPKILMLHLDKGYDKWSIISILNWQNNKIDFKLDFSKIGLDENSYHVYEFWDKKYYGIFRKEFFLKNIEPHGCKLLKIIKLKDAPQVLSTSFHFTQGQEVDEFYYNSTLKQLRFVVNLNKREKGDILIFIPFDFEVRKITSNSPEFFYKKIDKNVLEISSVIDNFAEFIITFSF